MKEGIGGLLAREMRTLNKERGEWGLDRKARATVAKCLRHKCGELQQHVMVLHLYCLLILVVSSAATAQEVLHDLKFQKI
jgi:hypothetical protein